MFPDSDIAKEFTVGRTKMRYVTVFGQTPYFRQVITKQVEGYEAMCLCYDEALNKVSQRGQMDVHVRFWHRSTDSVSTRYLSSAFMGHATAKDIEDSFLAATAGVDMEKIVQISMDGPNVNWKFDGVLKLRLKVDESSRELLDTGSCGLHVISGAFQTGNRNAWNINSFLQHLYLLFKDCPARCATYTEITQSSLWPLKFCQVRWVGNVKSAARAIQMFPHLRKWVENLKPKLNNAAFQLVEQCVCKDSLFLAKLHFFRFVAVQLEPFLTKFQTPRPMFPLLFESILGLVKLLMTKFIQANVLAASDSAMKVMALDINNLSNRLPVPEVGFSAVEAVKKSKASEDLKSVFYVEGRLFLVKCVEKILERSPLKYKFVRAASSLSPLLLATNPGLCRQRMQTLLELLVQAKWVSGEKADSVKSQFVAFSQNSVVAEQCRAFVKNEVPLDEFFVKVFHDVTGYVDLFFVVRLTLVMSHGNATVERGFSVNQDIVIENLQEESLMAQRVVYDAINSAGGALKIQLTPELWNI